MLPRIEEAVEYVYSKYGVADFYIGSRGKFDHLAAAAVQRLKRRHRGIRMYLLLAYHPGERTVDLRSVFDGSFYPPLEDVPRRYAIVRANQYMAETSDFLICYVAHNGNARNLLEYVQRRRKECVHLENVAEGT